MVEQVVAPVVPTHPAPPASTPAPDKSGRDLLREAKPVIDYSEKFDDGAKPVEEPPKVEVKPEPPKVDPKEKLLEQALVRQRIAEVEAERAKAERDLLYRQQLAAQQAQAQAGAPQSQGPTKEQLVAMYQEDPFQVIEMISQRVAQETKARTLAEVQQQGQQQEYVEDLTAKRQQFSANANKIVQENQELMDPEHALTKHLNAVQAEFPSLLMDPEGPIKGLGLAKQRLELEQLRAAKIVPPVVEEGKGTGAVQKPVSMAPMVTGPSRGVPPSPSVKLTPEERMAAQKMRITEEQFAAYRGSSPKYFQKEQAPKRRVG